MRCALFLALTLVAAGAVAQQPPPKLEPLLAPQEGDRVEEMREGGRVVMLKVTPPSGIPYYLVDLTGDGTLTRRESLDPGIRVPMWTIKTF